MREQQPGTASVRESSGWFECGAAAMSPAGDRLLRRLRVELSCGRPRPSSGSSVAGGSAARSLGGQLQLDRPHVALCPAHLHRALHGPAAQLVVAAHQAQLLPKLAVVGQLEGDGDTACGAGEGEGGPYRVDRRQRPPAAVERGGHPGARQRPPPLGSQPRPPLTHHRHWRSTAWPGAAGACAGEPQAAAARPGTASRRQLGMRSCQAARVGRRAALLANLSPTGKWGAWGSGRANGRTARPGGGAAAGRNVRQRAAGLQPELPGDGSGSAAAEMRSSIFAPPARIPLPVRPLGAPGAAAGFQGCLPLRLNHPIQSRDAMFGPRPPSGSRPPACLRPPRPRTLEATIQADVYICVHTPEGCCADDGRSQRKHRMHAQSCLQRDGRGCRRRSRDAVERGAHGLGEGLRRGAVWE